MRIASLVVLGMLGLAAPAAAEVELKNDGFVTNAQVGFQAGFVSGEIGASRFLAPEAGRQLRSVQLLFGGQAGTQTVTVKVWDDTAGMDAPGAELFSGDFQLMGANDALQAVDLTGMSITVPEQFRVGIVFQHDGLPSIARDNDGTIAGAKNYIFASGGLGWYKSQTLGLSGDWVIRAFVSDGAVVPPDGAVVPDGGVNPDGAVVPDAGVGSSCNGNAECPLGQFCDNNACTFDCREDADCGGGTCNSLGQCVGGAAADGDGGGCCQTERGGGEVGVLIFGALFGFGVLRRRRK
jgi:hypothetical protein